MSFKAKFLLIDYPMKSSFNIKIDRALETPFHFHPEIELLYSIRGRGTDYIGNSIETIEEGELLLYGENVPHTRLKDESFYETYPAETPEAIVIQFRKDFLGTNFFTYKELDHIGELINRSAKGLRFFGSTREGVSKKLLKISKKNGLAALLDLLSILDTLAKSEEYTFINKIDNSANLDTETLNRIKNVYQYTLDNFREPISLEYVSALAFLSPTAFCRFFKGHTRKTYHEYLTEVRIDNACKLLRSGNYDVKTASFESGFTNTPNFIKQFKKVTQMMPSEYRRTFNSKIINQSNLTSSEKGKRILTDKN